MKGAGRWLREPGPKSPPATGQRGKKDPMPEREETVALDPVALEQIERIPLNNLRTVRMVRGADKPKQRIRCPEHNTWMTWFPTDDTMRCTQQGCDLQSVRTHKFDSFWQVDGGTAPTVYRGEIKIVQDTSGGVYLYLADINGLVDVSRMISNLPPIETEDDGPEQERKVTFKGTA